MKNDEANEYDGTHLRQSVPAVLSLYQGMSLLHDFAARRDHPLRKSGVQVLEIDGEQVGSVVQSAVILDEKLVVI
jgi:hypothetical protein